MKNNYTIKLVFVTKFSDLDEVSLIVTTQVEGLKPSFPVEF